jgi:phospholipase C
LQEEVGLATAQRALSYPLFNRQMPPGLDQLKHIVVLMMENRSFDHMLGALRATDPRIDGFPDDWTNPGPNGEEIRVKLKASYRGQLTPDPQHHFPHVDQQIFNGDTSAGRRPTMKGFVRNYYTQRQDLDHAAHVMYAFKPQQLPVLTMLAREFAVFNAWFASIPGPTLCNRAFAHYGTSFGQVGMAWWYATKPTVSIYDRLIANGCTAKVYYFDQASSSLEVPNLLKNQPAVFGTYPEFLASCRNGTLPDYSFIEPNYTDHDGDSGEVLASDQHPDHHVREGDRFIGSIYNAIRRNEALWTTTALLVVYDEHGGLFDHVPPPPCTPDGYEAKPDETAGIPFKFDRLGVRVPAVLVSPWVPRGTVVPSTRVFEHASIPATVTKFFIGNYDDRTDREQQAETFLDLLSLPNPRTGGFIFADK